VSSDRLSEDTVERAPATPRVRRGLLSLFTRARELRTVWAVRKAGSQSYLAGTAHFFPYHFRRTLRGYLNRAGTILLEGPLDDKAMRRVVESGSATGAGRSLAEALDTATVLKINAEFGAPAPAFSGHPLYHEIFGSAPGSQLCVQIQGLKPWMGFFRIWTHYLQEHGWNFRMDVDALRAAADLGRPVQFLETIDEQIAALEGVPLARILEFLGAVNWTEYRREYVRHFLAGSLDALAATARVFPSFCESVLDRRDPILHERMRPHLERGNTIAFVGILHCPRIIGLLRADGYEVTPVSGEASR
jgi:uncharacterized protein YbaP (TraB family)